MNLAISSLAWKPADDDAVAELLKTYGFGGIELVPTKLWPDLSRAKETEVKAYRHYWTERGIQIVAMQALLFGRDDLTLFGSEEKRKEGIEYFKSIFKIAQWLGAHTLIYGSPKNRRGVDGHDKKIVNIALDYFRSLGILANDHGVCLCIEPLPRDYPCDFVNNSQEALEFVRRVDQKGFGLHLDACSLYQAGENAVQALEACRGRIEHFHLSQPALSPVIPSAPVPVGTYLNLLNELGYPNWASIEMLEPLPAESRIATIKKSLEHIRQLTDTACARR